MIPQTDIRFTFQIATVKLEPSELTEADLRAPAAEFARLTHANERAREDKLFVHKAQAQVEFKDGSPMQAGLMQSALFDSDKSNGKQELKELLRAIEETVIERMYEEKIVQ